MSDIMNRGESAPAASARNEVDTFLADLQRRAGSSMRGRLTFALDATASRQPTWDTACELQADMFRETATIGGLDVQLVYYRGLGECRASRWVSHAQRLGTLMERIEWRGGHTELGKDSAPAKADGEGVEVPAVELVGTV